MRLCINNKTKKKQQQQHPQPENENVELDHCLLTRKKRKKNVRL